MLCLQIFKLCKANKSILMNKVYVVALKISENLIKQKNGKINWGWECAKINCKPYNICNFLRPLNASCGMVSIWLYGITKSWSWPKFSKGWLWREAMWLEAKFNNFSSKHFFKFGTFLSLLNFNSLRKVIGKEKTMP